MPERRAVVVSAEHGGRRVPRRWAAAFRGRRELLDSHRGWDPGSLELGRELARRLEAPLVAATVTRLLVDCNRSEGSAALFSELTRALPEAERERIRLEHHSPHRRAVEAAVREALGGAGRVLHVAAHSFTPAWKGRTRDLDVGLLFDPRRGWEAAFVRRWRAALLELEPELRVRLNRPYRGWTDGLCTTLRGRLPAARYAGVELEVNQAITTGEPARWRRLRRGLAESLEAVA